MCFLIQQIDLIVLGTLTQLIIALQNFQMNEEKKRFI